jgi:hypothetical protein
VLISGAVAAETTALPAPLGEHAASRRPAPSSPCRMRERLVADSTS